MMTVPSARNTRLHRLLNLIRERKIKPLYLQLLAVTCYSVFARIHFNFENPFWYLPFCAALAAVLDIAIGRLMFGAARVPWAAITIGVSLSFLDDSIQLASYASAIGLAILSKAILRFEGRHFINPAVFGLVVLLQFGLFNTTTAPALFVSEWASSLVFLAVGGLVSWYARQLWLSVPFFLTFFILAALRMAWLGTSPMLAFGPGLGAGVILFAFHTLSDPATTPNTRRFKIIFGCGVATLDAAFRASAVPNGLFYSLFIMCCLMPLIRVMEAPTAQLLKKSDSRFPPAPA